MSSIHDAIEPLDGAAVHLRPATVADADAVTQILFDQGVADWWQTADPAQDAIELVDDDELAFWLIESDGAVVGIVMASEETDPQYRHGSIDIALAEAGRGRGLGPDAVRTVARWLIDVRGHHRLTIDPSATNERAIAAYAKLGFRPVGTMRAYERWRDGSWHDGLLMDMLADDLNDQPTQVDASNGDLIGSVILVADEDEAYLSTGAAWSAESPKPNHPGPPSVVLSIQLVQAIVDQARAEDPNEACGLIIGDRPAAEGGAGLRFEAVRNRAASPYRYEIHPDDLLRLTIATDDADEVFWAIVHSHVRSPAYPSPTDVGLAFYPDALYVLVSLAEDEPALGAFRIVDGTIHRVEILVGE